MAVKATSPASATVPSKYRILPAVPVNASPLVTSPIAVISPTPEVQVTISSDAFRHK